MNPNWLEAGAVEPRAVVSRVERDGVAAVISPPWGLVQNPYFESYLFACYEKPKPFFPPQSGPGEGLPFFLVSSHLQGTSPCEVPPPGNNSEPPSLQDAPHGGDVQVNPARRP